MKIFELKEKKLTENKNVIQDVIYLYAKKGYGNKKYCSQFVKNSHTVVFYRKEGKVVGVVRALSDEKRFAAIYDLFVLKEYRKQAIGSRLVKAICKYYQDLEVRFIYLTTDPNDPKLPEFYKKIGLKKVEGEEVFMWSFDI